MWRVALALLAGCCAVLCLPRLPSFGVLLLVCGALLLSGGLLRRTWLVAGAVGVAHCAWQAHAAFADRLAPELEGRTLEVTGTVVSVPQGTLGALRFRFAPDRIEGRANLPHTVELTWYDAPASVKPAERWRLELRLRRPRGFANPGGSDNEARLLRERIGATGYVRDGVRLGRAPQAWMRHPILLARGRVAEVVRAALADRPAAGIVAGLSVGLQDALSREQWLVLARTGTSHLMAISGLHIAMVAFLAAAGGACVQRWRQRRGAVGARRDVAVVTGALAALGYSLLAGWSVPTQRTMVMIALATLALLVRRRTGIADGFGACVVAVLLADPLAPLAVGFWLSFGAVAAILFATTGYARAPGVARGYLQVQVAVTLGLLPVLVASFGSVSLVAALVNLYAIPLYTLVIVPAVLLSCAAAVVAPGFGTPLLRGTAALIETTWPLLEVPATWSHATWAVAGLEPVAWAALLLGTVAMLAPLPRSGRLAGLALVLGACAWRPPTLPPGTARMTVLDVGQGLSVVVETRHHVLVFDAGPSFRTGSDTGQLVVVPYLRHRGVRELDALVVSHDDDDHKGGAASILEALPVRAMYAGPSVSREVLPHALARSVAWQACRRGARWTWDGVTFEWLHPGTRPHERDNDSSCVLRVGTATASALLTGDVEARGEIEMLEDTDLGEIAVMVAPHHGSRTSSSAAFVAATRPKWVVYSVGYRNRWNFPAGKVMERWRGVGAQAVQTDSSGAITFDLDAGPQTPGRWRVDHPKLWRDP